MPWEQASVTTQTAVKEASSLFLSSPGPRRESQGTRPPEPSPVKDGQEFFTRNKSHWVTDHRERMNFFGYHKSPVVGTAELSHVSISLLTVPLSYGYSKIKLSSNEFIKIGYLHSFKAFPPKYILMLGGFSIPPLKVCYLFLQKVELNFHSLVCGQDFVTHI